MIITKDYLHQIFNYQNGKLFCRVSRGAKKAGSEAGTKKHDGSVHVQINGKLYLAHRIIFVMHHGYWPEMVDHINRDRSDNRIENLRAATHSENAYNAIARKDSISKIKNINYNKKIKKWQVRIQSNNKRIYLGSFDSLEKANKKAIEMRNELHGKYARHGNLMTPQDAKDFVRTLP